MAWSLAFILILYCHGCGSDPVSALLVGQHHGGRGRHRYPGPLRRDPLRRQHTPPLRNSTPTLSSATSSSISDSARMMKMRKLALQLKEENSMPPMNGDDDPENRNLPVSLTFSSSKYDEDCRTPIESEFMGLISQFLSYTEQDIQSLTTTSTLYLHYNTEQHSKPSQPRRRSREEGIRYRTIYSGVQAAALEPDVLRAFTILFEDYIPIRLAGRRIYRHLHNVIEEVRAERRGEMNRARELCHDWDCIVNGDDDDDDGGATNVLEFARRVWDTLMDEALLLEHSLESNLEGREGTEQDGGVISVPQLLDLGVDQVLIQEGILENVAQLETIVRETALKEENVILQYHGHKEGKYLEMTFPMFMNVMYRCNVSSSSPKQTQYGNIFALLRKIEQKVLERRIAVGGVENDVSILLAAKSVHSGSSARCAKREKFSTRFDEYVSTFQLWERKFNSGDDIDNQQPHSQSRRFEILRGCFVGARNRRNVAALKIVYMDYAALRIGGDLIFQLMSKLTNKIM